MKLFKKFTMSALLGALLVVLVSGCGRRTVDFIGGDTESEGTNSQVTEETTQETEVGEEKSVWVYVCGQVQNPGVYVLKQGSRVCDVFAMAGGLTKEAATDYWNQAKVLQDGEMIYVPTIEEAKERLPEAGVGDLDNQQPGKININIASVEDLMTLPGVGESKAKSIVEYRKAHGKFGSIEDIMNVSGIKEAMYEKIKEYISVN
ncbi:MAG: helix-hairpin-helix domain-containing protein [Agathobacter sp.]|nr:helix-hairpin-helix domain-containing protein [Agathobacter sp.]